MLKRLSLWDVDGVWYEGISTDYVAELSIVDPDEMLRYFLDSSMVSQNDVDLWCSGGKEIGTPADLSRMLHDLFHKMKQDRKPRISRDVYLRSRQLLAKGMTMQQIRKVADVVPYNPGVREAAKTLRIQDVHQIAFTDGLGPFVHYKLSRMVDYLESVPMLVEAAGNRVYFNGEMSNRDDVVLTGETEHFDKARQHTHTFSKTTISFPTLPL